LIENSFSVLTLSVTVVDSVVMGFSVEGEVPRGDKETGDVPTSAVLRFVVSGSVVTFDELAWWW
jgi:hypothetical protein